MEMDIASLKSASEEGLPKGESPNLVHLALRIAQTNHNDQASLTVGVPPSVIIYGKSLGKGAYGHAF